MYTQEELFNALEEVIDPELGVDIVNLGLVYEIKYLDDTTLAVDMTLTSMACPLADVILQSVEQALLELDGIDNVQLELVWYPPWTPEKMTRYARIALGIR